MKAKQYSGIVLITVAVVVVACDGSNGDRQTTQALPARSSTSMAAGTPSARHDRVKVYKSPTCSCCTKWVRYLERNGFEVAVHDTRELAPVKDHFGIPEALRSCHTATVGDYVIEGHVPVEEIRRLIATAPRGLIAVPGMPLGSPGMEHPAGATAYDTLHVDADGTVRVFAHHPASAP